MVRNLAMVKALTTEQRGKATARAEIPLRSFVFDEWM